MTDDAQKELTHLDSAGQARMVDVGQKDVTERKATASAEVMMSKETLELVVKQGLKKGDALSAARIAGIMAAKKTPELIPLAHPIGLSRVAVTLEPDHERGVLKIFAEVGCVGRTGVEMEALTAASVAALTVYDMVKSVDRGVVISDIKLLEKSGGRSGSWKRE